MRRLTVVIALSGLLVLGACSGGSSDGGGSSKNPDDGAPAATTMVTDGPLPTEATTTTTKPITEIPQAVKDLAPTVSPRILAARDKATAIVEACATDQRGAACQAGLQSGVVDTFAELQQLGDDIEKAAGGPLPASLQDTVDAINEAAATRAEIAKCDLTKPACQGLVSKLVSQIDDIASTAANWEGLT